jgi:ABC-type lipoprotein release transport system permease subunit
MNGLMSIGPLMWQRLVANWRLLLVLAFGILVAATLLAVSPVYTRVMNDLGLQASLQQQIGSASRNGAIVHGQVLGDAGNGRRAQELAQTMSEEIGWFTETEVRFGAMPFLTLAREGQALATGMDRPLIRATTMSGIEDHVNVVEGRLPLPTTNPNEIEVLVPVESARFLNASLGDRVQAGAGFDDCNRPPPTQDPEQARELALFRCTPQTFVELRATFTIVGFIERSDANDRFWGAGQISFNPPFATDEMGPVVTVVLPEQSFFQALPGVLRSFPYELRLTGFADIARLNSSNLQRARESIENLRARLQQTGAIADLAMAGPLSAFQNRASFNQVSLLLLLLQVVGIAIYYVVLVSSLLAERRAEEIAMLRSRGASVTQLVAMSAGEAFSLGLVAAFVAPVLASAAVAGLGKTGTFESISGGGFLPFTIVPVSFAFALAGAGIAAVATIIPAFFAARRGMVLFLRSSARPGKPFLQRYYLDLGLVGLAALALWQMSQRGSVFDARSVGGWSADPLLLLSPLLLILAIGATMFRFLPLLLGLVTRVLQRTAGPGVTLGLWQLTRSPARYTQLALLVVMAAAVGTFAATYGETTDRSQEERALYAVGTDVRLTGLGRLGVNFSDEVVESLEAVDGVDQAVTAFRSGYTIGPLPNFGARVDVLGVDPAEAGDLLWFRDDFAQQELRPLLARITGSPVTQHGIALQGEPGAISIWANPIEARVGTTLWVRSLDARGIYRFHELGTLDFTGYRRLETQLNPARDGMVFPISIVALVMTQSENISDPGRNVLFDDLAMTDESGAEVLIEDFEGAFRWDVLRTATRNRDEAQQVGQNSHSGNGAALFSFLTGTNAPLRGIYVIDPNIPVPAIASRHFMEVTGLRIGGEVDLVFGKMLLPVSVQGVVDFFPTMYDGPAGYLVINQEHLYHYAGLTSENPNAGPTEAWLTLSRDPEERRAAQTALLDSYGIPAGQVIDRERILEEIRTDPVVRAGGSGILLLALIAAFAILALGFSLTLYLGGQSRTVEVSVMRAVGISPRQLFAMISLEYLLIAAVGLIIGTVAGLRISDTMLGFLNVTETGARVVPPFDLVTRWDTVGIAFAAVGIAFLAGVIALAGYFLRLPVSRVIRMTR